MDTSKRIKARRKELKMTQEQLSKKVGVARTTVYSWEKGDFLPEGDNLKNLAKALDTTQAYLLMETSDEKAMKGYMSLVMRCDDKDNGAMSILPRFKTLPGQLFRIGDIVFVPRVNLSDIDINRTFNEIQTRKTTNENEILDYEPIIFRLLGHVLNEKPPRAYRVEGSNMVDFGVPENSWVVVNPGENISAGTICLVNIDGTLAVKKVYPKENSKELRSSDGESFWASQNDIKNGYVKIYGKIVGIEGSLNHRP